MDSYVCACDYCLKIECRLFGCEKEIGMGSVVRGQTQDKLFNTNV